MQFSSLFPSACVVSSVLSIAILVLVMCARPRGDAGVGLRILVAVLLVVWWLGSSLAMVLLIQRP